MYFHLCYTLYGKIFINYTNLPQFKSVKSMHGINWLKLCQITCRAYLLVIFLFFNFLLFTFLEHPVCFNVNQNICKLYIFSKRHHYTMQICYSFCLNYFTFFLMSILDQHVFKAFIFLFHPVYCG